MISWAPGSNRMLRASQAMPGKLGQVQPPLQPQYRQLPALSRQLSNGCARGSGAPARRPSQQHVAQTSTDHRPSLGVVL